MGALHIIQARLNYLRTAKRGGHGVHSPFVFHLATKVLPSSKNEDFSDHIAEDWRTTCMLDNATLNVLDLGTGKSGPRKISEIASKSAESPTQGQLLFRIIKHFKPKKMLELGTSLGITSLYEATANPFDHFITIEGCPETAAKAKGIFEKHNLKIDVRVGDFSKQLPDALKSLGKLDFVYFDGNHREAPTLEYFETCLPFIHNETILVFDDIHWSEEMESAWIKIKSHPKVRVSIDLFHLGIVFFRAEHLEKEEFTLKF